MKSIYLWCLAVGLVLSQELQASPVVWSGGGGTDTNWSNAANWTGAAVPGTSDDVQFFDPGSVTLPNTNNVVNASVTIGSLQYGNTNNTHTTLIANGVMLTITNTGGLVASTPGDPGVAKLLTNVITGFGGTLNMTNPNAVVSVNQGGATGSSRAILNLSGLSTFAASIHRIGVGTSTSYNPSLGNKLGGTFFMAQTNVIVLSLTDTLANYQTSGTRTNSIEVGRNPSNNGGVPTCLYLGQSNILFLDSIDTGMGKQSGTTTWGWMGFNPAFTNNNPVGYFRGVSGGTSRVTWWSIGDGTSVGSSSNGGVGTNDFSNGTLDAMINVLSIGRDATATDTWAGPHRGYLAYTAGLIDVNTVYVGNQSLETGASSTACLGTINMGPKAVLRVNTAMTLGFTTLATAAAANTSGNLIVNGGTVYANTIAVGASSSANNLRLSAAALIVSNTIATNATGLLNFAISNSVLGLTVTTNGSLRGLTKNLLTGGSTNVIQLDPQPVIFAAYPQQFPLIKYTTWTGTNNFSLTNVPAWAVGATLVSNGLNSSLDLSLPADPQPVFTSQPTPYSGNPGDNVTANFAVTIAAASVTPLGYQWYRVSGGATNQLSDGAGPGGSSTFSGSTTANLQIANAQPADSGSFFVVVTNMFGTNTSSQVLLTISVGAIPPAVTGPATLTATNGVSTMIADVASGSPVPVLYWQYNGNPLVDGTGPGGSSTISGSSTATLVISNPQYPGDQGTYSLIASNSAGLATNSTVLTVIVPPTISVQPTNLAVVNSQGAAFSVTASGVPAPTYQWYKGSLANPVSSALNPTATNATFSLASTSPGDSANYFVVVQNAAGAVTSSNAALTVNSTIGYNSLKPGNGATGICYDTPLYITFTATPTLRAAGKIRIYNATNSVTPVDTIDLSLCATNFPTYAVNVQPYTISGDLFTNFPVIISGTTAAIYPHQGLLTSNQTYYVTLDDGTFVDGVGAYFAGITDTNAWRFTTKPTGPAISTNLVVAQDYSGDFATVQGAVNSVASGNTTPTIINIRNGTYTELVNIKTRNNLDLRGQSRSGVLLGYPNNNNVFGGAPQRAAFVLNGNDCTLETLTLTNTTLVGGGQAEAVDVEGTRAIFYNMELDSYQDTFLVHSAGKLVYFQDCLIQGQTDFNWGYGTVYYTNCEVRCLLAGGHVTQPRSPATTNGFGFINCRITQGYAGSSTFDLGRTIGTPTSPSEALFYNCLMADVVTGYASDAGANMADYGTSNLTATATKTLVFSTHSPGNDPFVIAIQSATNWLYGWQPQVAPVILGNPAPAAVTAGQNTSFTVAATGLPGPAYQWIKNGTNVPGATGPVLNIATATSDSVGTYSVIVTTSAGSVTSSVVNLTVNRLLINVAADPKNKIYGTADPALTYQYSPALIGSDSFSGGLTRVIGQNIGSYAIAQGSLSLNANYSIGFTGTNLTITPAALTVTANSTNKVYGHAITFAGTEFTAAGLTNGDSISSVALASTGAAGSAPVSTYAIIPSAASGTGLGNYTIGYVNGSLVVNPASQPTAQNITSANGSSIITFAGIPGVTYVTQSAANLIGPWTAISTNTPGMDGGWTVTNAVLGVDQQFFRTLIP